MRATRSAALLLLPALLLCFWISCGGTTPGTQDSGTPGQDSGTTVQDSGTTVQDSGTPDSGTPVVDSGTPDSGTPVVDSGTPDAGKADAGADAGRPMLDAGYFDCAGTVCGGGNVCCFSLNDAGTASASCQASCGTDAGFTVSCDGPEDCGSGASQVCCGSATVGIGIPPACPPQSVSAVCKAAAACPTTLPAACPGVAQVRLCHADADCGEAAYPYCCAFQQATVTTRICVGTDVKMFTNCMP